jgi:hypothetical protein
MPQLYATAVDEALRLTRRACSEKEEGDHVGFLALKRPWGGRGGARSEDKIHDAMGSITYIYIYIYTIYIYIYIYTRQTVAETGAKGARRQYKIKPGDEPGIGTDRHKLGTTTEGPCLKQT